MADVFVSYVSEDRARAAALAGALETTGYSVWWDRDLHGGADFAAEIERQLAAAAAVIVLWSTRSRDSQWVRDEASYARDANKLVPVRIDDGALPLGFRQLQSIELGSWGGDEADPAFTRLLTSLQHFVAEPRTATRVSSVKPRRSARAAWIVAAAVVLCGAAGLAWWRLDRTESAATDTERYTVSVHPISSPADGSLEGTGNIVVNDLIRTLAAADVPVRGPSTPGAPDRAGYRIGGDVQRTGDTAALSLHLIGTDTGRIVWAEAFPMSAAAARFDRAAYVSVAIQSAISIEEWGKVLPTRSSEARELSVQAFHEMNQYTFGERGSDLVAAQRLESALRLDPTLVDAHWLLAIIYSNRLGFTIRAEGAAPIAHEHAKEVIEHDSRDTHALGQINLQLDLDYAAALANFERARGKAPDTIIESAIGRVRFAQGNLDAALRHLQNADIGGSYRDTALVAAELASVLAVAGRLDAARRAVDRALTLVHDASIFGLTALLTKVRIAHAQGDLAAANEALDRAWHAHGGERPEWFPGALARLGRVDEAKRILAEAEIRFQAGTLGFMTGASEGALLLGELDRTFVWLERAIDNREFWLFGHLRASPLFEPVRGDPRFAAAMKRLEALEAQGSRKD